MSIVLDTPPTQPLRLGHPRLIDPLFGPAPTWAMTDTPTPLFDEVQAEPAVTA